MTPPVPQTAEPACAPANQNIKAVNILAAASQLLASVERGQALDARLLRAAMTSAFKASDQDGAWVWKDAYEASEAAAILFLRKYAPGMLRKKLLVVPQSRYRQGAPIRIAEGVLFTTYATLRSCEREGKDSRLKQILDWLGKQFDGVILFDEAHAMANAAGEKSERGDKAPSQQGRAGRRRTL